MTIFFIILEKDSEDSRQRWFLLKVNPYLSSLPSIFSLIDNADSHYCRHATCASALSLRKVNTMKNPILTYR